LGGNPLLRRIRDSECEKIAVETEVSTAQIDQIDTCAFIAYSEKDMNTDTVVTLTENAANEIRAKLAADAEGAAKGLRLYVEKGGCSGLQYGMTFDQKRPDDFESSYFGVSVLVDPFSADYLRGTVVDYSDALTGGGFKITNPKAAQSCGCGKSFEAERQG
jgi:iron-sulfur cluster assembly accessory protein